jgi:hypothetical protein
MWTTCSSAGKALMPTKTLVAWHPVATRRGVPADLLTSITLDAWLLATYGPAPESLPDGRTWERTVSDSLRHPGIHRRQHAGFTHLFDQRSTSGCRHELDGAADGWAGRVVVEAKARADGLRKDDVALFHLKTFDYYTRALPGASSDRWWRLLVSAGPVREDVRRLCATQAIVVVEPGILPIPVLVWTAGRPEADRFLRNPLLQELLRIGGRAMAPMQQRWAPDGAGGLRYDTTWWKPDALDDLVWLQKEVSEDVLNLYETWDPKWLRGRAAKLVEWARGRGMVL